MAMQRESDVRAVVDGLMKASTAAAENGDAESSDALLDMAIALDWAAGGQDGFEQFGGQYGMLKHLGIELPSAAH